MNNFPQNPPSEPDKTNAPAWHGDVLCARAERIARGEAQRVPFEDAKQRLQEKYGRARGEAGTPL